MIDAAKFEGTSIGRNMVATGHSTVVELTVVVMVVEAAAGKEAGVLLTGLLLLCARMRVEYARRDMGRRKRDVILKRSGRVILIFLLEQILSEFRVA